MHWALTAVDTDNFSYFMTGERPFQCKVCKMTFTTNGNMHRHSRIHAKDELKAAMSQASLETGTKASRSSSSTSSKARLPNVIQPASSAGNKGTIRTSWHKPGSYNHKEIISTESILKKVTSGVDLHQALHGKIQFFSSPRFMVCSNESLSDSNSTLFSAHLDLKRTSQQESTTSPSSKKRKYDNDIDLKAGSPTQEMLQVDAERFGNEGDLAVDLTIADAAVSEYENNALCSCLFSLCTLLLVAIFSLLKVPCSKPTLYGIAWFFITLVKDIT